MSFRLFTPMFLAATLASAALAQGQAGTHFVENWDLDGDGQVSSNEATEKRYQLFSMFDQDSNNVLDTFEYGNFDNTRMADMNENAGGAEFGADGHCERRSDPRIQRHRWRWCGQPG